MRRKLTLAIALLSLVAAARLAGEEDAMSAPVQDLVKMAKAGVDESVLIAYAQQSRARFDLSANAEERLRAAGLPQSVIEAMRRRDRELSGPSSVARGPVAEDELFRMRFGYIQYGGRIYPYSNGLPPALKSALESDTAVAQDISSYASLHSTSRAALWGGLSLIVGGSVYGMISTGNGWDSRSLDRGIFAGAIGAGLVSLIVSAITGDSAYLHLYNGLAQYNRDLLAQDSGR